VAGFSIHFVMSSSGKLTADQSEIARKLAGTSITKYAAEISGTNVYRGQWDAQRLTIAYLWFVLIKDSSRKYFSHALLKNKDVAITVLKVFITEDEWTAIKDKGKKMSAEFWVDQKAAATLRADGDSSLRSLFKGIMENEGTLAELLVILATKAHKAPSDRQSGSKVSVCTPSLGRVDSQANAALEAKLTGALSFPKPISGASMDPWNALEVETKVGEPPRKLSGPEKGRLYWLCHYIDSESTRGYGSLSADGKHVAGEWPIFDDGAAHQKRYGTLPTPYCGSHKLATADEVVDFLQVLCDIGDKKRDKSDNAVANVLSAYSSGSATDPKSSRPRAELLALIEMARVFAAANTDGKITKPQIEHTFNRGTKFTTLGLPVLCGIIKNHKTGTKLKTSGDSALLDSLFDKEEQAPEPASPTEALSASAVLEEKRTDTAQEIRKRLRGGGDKTDITPGGAASSDTSSLGAGTAVAVKPKVTSVASVSSDAVWTPSHARCAIFACLIISVIVCLILLFVLSAWLAREGYFNFGRARE
jgi:hypothetical protein